MYFRTSWKMYTSHEDIGYDFEDDPKDKIDLSFCSCFTTGKLKGLLLGSVVHPCSSILEEVCRGSFRMFFISFLRSELFEGRKEEVSFLANLRKTCVPYLVI